uniref:Claudin 5b n=1 Tax=Stegastes partitus TaxID=144197 RepID=A0A3B4YTE0_9TELE
MLAACLEFLGLALCVTGSLLVMVACGLPMWKVTAFIDSNIVVAQTIWDGLWMSCVVQSTGQMQYPDQLCLHIRDHLESCCRLVLKIFNKLRRKTPTSSWNKLNFSSC